MPSSKRDFDFPIRQAAAEIAQAFLAGLFFLAFVVVAFFLRILYFPFCFSIGVKPTRAGEWFNAGEIDVVTAFPS